MMKLKMKPSRRFVLAGAVCFFIVLLNVSKEGKLVTESNVDYEEVAPPHGAAAVQEGSNQRSDQQEPQEQKDGSSANSTSTNAVQKDQEGGGLPPAAATEPSPPEEQPEPSPVPRGRDSYTMEEMCSSSYFSASQKWQQ